MTYKWIEEDRSLVTRSAEELDQYLSSQVLLWRIAGLETPLTPGNLLLSMRRLMAVEDTKSISPQDRITSLVDTRRAAWVKKAGLDLSMRVNQWDELVEEINRYGSLDASFQYSARARVIIDLLSAETRTIENDLQLRVENADRRLLLMTTTGKFIWDAELREAFPPETYPYLYLQAGKQDE